MKIRTYHLTFITQGQQLYDSFPVTITVIREFWYIALAHALQTFDNYDLEVAACHFKQLYTSCSRLFWLLFLSKDKLSLFLVPD